jgi:putative NADPH-quinone reductase
MVYDLVVIPNSKSASFTRAMGHVAIKGLHGLGHEVTARDRYAESFQPVLHPVEAATAGPNAFTNGADPLVTGHRRRPAAADILVVLNTTDPPPDREAAVFGAPLGVGSRGEGDQANATG